MVSTKRLKHEDVARMEDSEYRDLLRSDLNARRREMVHRGRAGEAVLSLLLIVAFGAVLLHYFEIIKLTP